MKKIYLLILTLLLTQGVLHSQTYADGDYRTIETSDSYIFWGSASNWEVYDLATDSWTTATDAPGKGGNNITTNVYVSELTIMLNEEITIDAGGKVIITDIGPDNYYLYIGYNGDYSSSLYVYGEVVIESGDTQLNIQETSTLYIKPGGKVTDQSTGNIVNGNTTGGILIQSSSTPGQENGSLITSTVSLNGTVDQYISSGQWHLVSIPVDIVTVNEFWNGSDDAFMRDFTFGWNDYITDVNTALNVGEGYEVWETITGGLSVSTSGTFNAGSYTLTVATGGSGIYADWNSVGNPFPCGLDWDLVSTKTNVEGSAFYLWNGSAWTSYDGVTGDANHIIPPFQGFFVKYLSGDITVNDGDKAHPGSSNDLNKSTNADYTNHIKLEASMNGQKSNTFCYQRNEATNGNDMEYDAPKLFGNSNIMEVYTFAGDKKSSINVYGEYPYVMEVAFKVPDGGGDITLTPKDLRNLDANLLVFLEDKETGDYFNFLENPTYTFTAQSGDVTDRIRLIFNNNVGTEDINTDDIKIYSNKNAIYLNFSNQQFNGELKVYNVIGQTVYSAKTSNNLYQPLYLNQPSGYYLVELITENESFTQKVFIQQ